MELIQPVQNYGDIVINLLSVTYYEKCRGGCIRIHFSGDKENYATIWETYNIERFEKDFNKIHQQNANNLQNVIGKLIETIQFVPGGSECLIAEKNFIDNMNK